MGDNAPPPYPGEKGGNPQYPPPGQGYAPPPQPYQPGAPAYGQQPPYGAGYGQPPMQGADPAHVHLQEQGGPPPQGGYYPAQPGQPGQPTTVVVTQPAVAVVQTFRESPVHTRCPHCQAEVVTGTQYETGTFAWIICVVLCVIGCDLGCCLIPFCVDGCKDVVHICPNCRQQVARWSRM